MNKLREKLPAHSELIVFNLFFCLIKTGTSVGYWSAERIDSYL